jgi:hypothetical protein
MGEGASTLLSLPDGRASSSIFLWGRNATKAGLATSRTKAIAIPTTTIPGSFVGGIFRVLESLDWNWRSIERVAGSDRVTLSITLIGNVQQYYQSTPSPGHFKRKLSDFASILLHNSGNAASPKSVTLRRLDQSILRKLPE